MDEDNDWVTNLFSASREIIEDPLSKEKKAHLVYLINELILHDFNALVQLLYRIDVDEKKLKKTLSNNPVGDAASIIADLIIERQIQKVKSKNSFQQDHTSDDELW